MWEMKVKTISDLLYATYRVRDRAAHLHKRAESIAIGLTVGSWTELPEARQAEVKHHCGVVQSVSVLADDKQAQARSTGRELDAETVWADLTIGYPLANFTETAAALLTTVFGKLSMDGEIKLVGLELPPAYVRQFPGPAFGVSGLREQLGVAKRPLLMSIFKSCVGYQLPELRAQFREQAMGGADLIKDDEIFFTEQYATPEERVIAFRREADEVFATTGHRAQYAVNLTGSVTSLRERARRLSDSGAEALLINVYAYGLDALRELAEDPMVTAPLLAHPAVAGALYAAPSHGISASIVLGQLLRLCGADVVIYPSPYGSVTLPREEGVALLAALRDQTGQRPAMPAPSAGIHPGLVPALLRDAGTDVIVNAGGGIHGHPAGVSAGGRAFRAAIDACMQEQTLDHAAASSDELRQAIAKWGNGS